MWVGFQIAFSNGFPDKWLESKWICMEEVSKYLFQKLPKGAYLWGILEHCSWHQLQRARDSENWHKNGNQPLVWIFRGWKYCPRKLNQRIFTQRRSNKALKIQENNVPSLVPPSFSFLLLQMPLQVSRSLLPASHPILNSFSNFL